MKMQNLNNIIATGLAAGLCIIYSVNVVADWQERRLMEPTSTELASENAESFMTKEQRQATFCGKTFDGENLISGTTFKIHIDSECKTNTIHFLTGKKAGKTKERKIISMSDEGELCHTSNRDYCNKMKDMRDGTYKGTGTSGKWKDKEYVKLSNLVDGNQL